VSKRLRVVILASGSGTNAENLIRYQKEKEHFEVCAVVTDRAEAGVIAKAKDLGVHCEVITPNKDIKDLSARKSEHEGRLLFHLQSLNVDWILLAGYMRIFTADFLSHWNSEDNDINRVVNIHPSMLPLFPGKDGYGDAFKAGVKESGITIHFVDSGVDTGPILMQESFERQEGDTLETFKARGMQVEYELYRKAIDHIVQTCGEFQ
jgi:phosphoribosylglycinamide formyltransferase-1